MGESIFSGMAAAKPAHSGDYIGVGEYAAVINRVKVGETRKKIPFFAVEMTVIGIADDMDGTAAHKVGEEITWMITTQSDFFLKEIKSFMCAILGEHPEDVDEEMCESVTVAEGPEANPLQWLCLLVRTSEHPKKEGNGVYTKTRFKRHLPVTEALTNWEEGTAKAIPMEVLERLVAQEEAEGAE